LQIIVFIVVHFSIRLICACNSNWIEHCLSLSIGDDKWTDKRSFSPSLISDRNEIRLWIGAAKGPIWPEETTETMLHYVR